jgi:hypothetical protein
MQKNADLVSKANASNRIYQTTLRLLVPSGRNRCWGSLGYRCTSSGFEACVIRVLFVEVVVWFGLQLGR